jgi:hypothetical protein
LTKWNMKYKLNTNSFYALGKNPVVSILPIFGVQPFHYQ